MRLPSTELMEKARLPCTRTQPPPPPPPTRQHVPIHLRSGAAPLCVAAKPHGAVALGHACPAHLAGHCQAGRLHAGVPLPAAQHALRVSWAHAKPPQQAGSRLGWRQPPPSTWQPSIASAPHPFTHTPEVAKQLLTAHTVPHIHHKQREAVVGRDIPGRCLLLRHGLRGLVLRCRRLCAGTVRRRAARLGRRLAQRHLYCD